MTARRVRPANRKPKRRSIRTPEEIARAATAHDVPAGPSGDKVKVSLTLTLSRARVERLTARAIREGKNLESLIVEILERVPVAAAGGGTVGGTPAGTRP